MNIKKIDIDKLKASSYNPRKDLISSDAEYQKIKKSIETFGYIDPVIVNKDMTVIGGHQRIKVLKDLGYTEIDCVITDIDKTQEKALNIALNKISGEWDMSALKNLLQELDTGEIDVLLTGFDFDEIENMMTQLGEDKKVENYSDINKEIENYSYENKKDEDCSDKDCSDENCSDKDCSDENCSDEDCSDENKKVESYSDKNKEIDIDLLDDKMILKFKFNESDYEFVKNELGKITPNIEQALLKLLRGQYEQS